VLENNFSMFDKSVVEFQLLLIGVLYVCNRMFTPFDDN